MYYSASIAKEGISVEELRNVYWLLVWIVSRLWDKVEFYWRAGYVDI